MQKVINKFYGQKQKLEDAYTAKIEKFLMELDVKDELSEIVVRQFFATLVLPDQKLELTARQDEYERVITYTELIRRIVDVVLTKEINITKEQFDKIPKQVDFLMKKFNGSYRYSSVNNVLILSTNVVKLPTKLSKLFTLSNVYPPLLEQGHKWRYELGELKTPYEELKFRLHTKNSSEEQPEEAFEHLNILNKVQYKLSPNASRYIDLETNRRNEEAKEDSIGGFDFANKVKMNMLYNHQVKRTIKLLTDKEFNFAWQFDSRGRIYPRAYGINPQGAANEKATIVPTTKLHNALPKPDNVTAEEWFNPNSPIHYWLAVEVATRFGHDKISFDDRVEWTMLNLNNLKSLVKDADEKALFLNAVDALYSELAGKTKPCFVHLDATNQALQLFSVIFRDNEAALHCNVKNKIEDGKVIRGDAYQALADRLNMITGTDLFTRNNCKYAVMTGFYNKTDISSEIIKKTPDIVDRLGIDIETFKQIVRNAFQDVFPSGSMAMSQVQEIFELSKKATVKWTMPNGFKAQFHSEDALMVNFKYTQPDGKIRTMEVAKKKKMFSPFYRGAAANIIHSIDGWILSEVIKKMDAIGAPMEVIHDDYGTYPQFVPHMIRFYKETLVELMNSTLFEDIIKEAFDMPFYMDKGGLTADDIMNAEYILS